ncbi:tripartite tricarboxylate transporter substrate-binding protein [Roseateles sp. L2-2]|uniref:tripartite tricarboxylate transporter substrate-binding protein n=1 Tax=Roseateles TaxID=93681 RepID=UPI003D35C045
MPDPKHSPGRPPSPTASGHRLRVVDALRPWLIAIGWLLFAGLFKAALAQTSVSAGATSLTSIDASAEGDPPPLTLVIPFSAGSGPDHVAHTMARVWTERSGQRVVVRNLPDRQGYLAAREVSTAPPDGRTVLMTCSTLLERPARLPDDPFQPPAASAEDFTPISRVGQLPFVTVFPPGMFGRWLTPLSTPPAFGATSAAASTPATSAAALSGVLPATPADRSPLAAPPDWEDFDALTSRDAPAWNALLAPPHLPGKLADQLRATWGQVVSDPRVRMALAQTGTELWERIPAGGVR